MAFQLKCMGILRKKANSRYEFVVRWFLDDDQDTQTSYLPNPDSVFQLTIQTIKSKRYIKSDGSLADIPAGGAGMDLPLVVPMNFMMVKPPEGSNKPPQAPIDPTDLTAKNGVGIFHVLAETMSSRYTHKIFEIVLKTITSNIRFRQHSFFNDVHPEAYARSFSRYLTKEKIRPADLQSIFIHAYEQLSDKVFKTRDLLTLEDIPKLFTFHLTNADEKTAISSYNSGPAMVDRIMQHALFLKDLFKQVDMLQRSDKEVKVAENLKSQFSFLGIQGAEVIDYWCSPYQSQPNRIENDCGKRYTCSEAVGLGKSIGDLDGKIINDWITSGDSIAITVDYTPPTLTTLLNSKHYDWGSLHDNSLLAIFPAITSPSTPITTIGVNSLTNAVTWGSSCPPDAPKAARVDFDLFMNRMMTTFGGDQSVAGHLPYSDKVTSFTGDGRILVNVTKPDEKIFPLFVSPKTATIIAEDSTTVITGVNIYGIWQPETAGAYDQYFSDPNAQPSFVQLAPWLMTRRYSYLNDISYFFDPANPNLATIRQFPPRSPAFQAPGTVTSADRIVAVIKENTVLKETMPRLKIADATPGQVDFSFNIRDGFSNQFDPVTLQSWDKFPLSSLKQDWQPSTWRSGNTKNIPQAYRFWATSIDVFGQESPAISVVIKENNSATPANLFYFKYRNALLSPPSNDSNGNAKITIENINNNLLVNWESPFESSLGNSYDPANAALSRIRKDNLLANLVYLKRPHVEFSPEIPDGDIDAYIASTIFPALPADLRNDKWKIGFREILKHNGNWKIHKTFINVINTVNTNDTWDHQCPLTAQDSGYDYLALVNFEIKANQQQFWTASELLRNIIYSEQTKANPINPSYYKLGTRQIEETPVISNIVSTPSIVVANLSPPKLINLVAAEFNYAKPLPGIQGIDRDILLSNLQTIPDAAQEVIICGQKVPAVVFASSAKEITQGIFYTSTQAILIDASLKRTSVPNGADLGAATLLLQTELSNLNKQLFPQQKDDSGNEWPIFTGDLDRQVAQTSLTGFRGLKHFHLHYDSVYTQSGADTASEALKYRVYQAHIPLLDNKKLTASFLSTSFVMESTDRFSQVILDVVVKPEEMTIAVYVLAEFSSGYYVSRISNFSADAKGTYTIDLDKSVQQEGSISGKPDRLIFVVSPQLYEKEFMPDASGNYDEDLFLPVGGGYKELIIWSFVTISALGYTSSNVIVTSQVFQTSILPPMPAKLEADTINNQDQKTSYVLSKTIDKKWLPIALQTTVGNLTRFPRNYLKWLMTTSVPDDVFLTIQRQARNETLLSLKRLLKAQNNWDLASQIEKIQLIDNNPYNTDGTPNVDYNPYGLMRLDWLAPDKIPSLYQWLYNSSEIKAPGVDSAPAPAYTQLVGPLSKLFDPSTQLKANSGLLQDNLQPDHKLMFIDYFYANDDLNNEMDTFWSYNYCLQTYVDIDPQGQLDPSLKYLYSQPTPWSGWVRPTFPEIERVDTTIVTDLQAPNSPTVKFSFNLNTVTSRHSLLDIPRQIFYRIFVRKKIDNSIYAYDQVAGPVKPVFLEVGTLLDMPIKPDPVEYAIIDNNLERVDPGIQITNSYQIDILVIAKDELGNIDIVRKPFTKQMDVTIEPETGTKEIQKDVTITIV
jgi:hypothetical protein